MIDTITVKYFGEIAEAASCNSEELLIKSDKLSDFIDHIVEKYNLNQFSFSVALNQNMIDLNKDIRIKNNDELAILPPFAGG